MQSIKEKMELIEIEVSKAQGEMEKFTEKGNASAGTRLRGHMQSIRTLAKDLRDLVQAAKKK